MLLFVYLANEMGVGGGGGGLMTLGLVYTFWIQLAQNCMSFTGMATIIKL